MLVLVEKRRRVMLGDSCAKGKGEEKAAHECILHIAHSTDTDSEYKQPVSLILPSKTSS